MSLPLRQVTTDRLWQGLPVKQLTNTETGQSELFLNNPLAPNTKFAEVGANNEWTITNESELLRVYNNKARTTGGNTITEGELEVLFNTDGVKTFNNDRADVINKNSPTNTKTFLSTKPNPVPGVIDPATNTKPGADGRRVPADAPTPDAPTPGAPTPDASTPFDSDFTIKGKDQIDFKNWRYPIGKSDQDVIKFTMREYKPPSGLIKKEDRTGQTGDILGTVVLPIQPTIIDNNSVGWQQDTLNPFEVAGLQLFSGAVSGGPGGAKGAIEGIIGDLNDEQGNLKKALLAYLAGQAISKNVTARVSGAILNPNIELLFNAPELRTFSYRFQLSAREKEESRQIRGIIGWFKAGMAARRTDAELFLVTPNVFDIQYIYKNDENKDHPYLNRIKTCALTNCSVDYTPTGSYMTFPDGSMVSYTINLTFQELEPIYQDDYTTPVGTEIGF